jgi:hypothetical protein
LMLRQIAGTERHRRIAHANRDLTTANAWFSVNTDQVFDSRLHVGRERFICTDPVSI